MRVIKNSVSVSFGRVRWPLLLTEPWSRVRSKTERAGGRQSRELIIGLMGALLSLVSDLGILKRPPEAYG